MQSRYYNPEIGRFINADALASTGQGLLGNNMYVYCLNNPINQCDPTGLSAHKPAEPWNCTCSRCMHLPIDNQDDEAIAQKRLGITTVGHAGCGPIAVYNATVTLDMGLSFDEILNYYNSKILRMHLLGRAGTPVGLIKDFFEEKGYYVYCAYTLDSIAAASQIANASIIYYKFPDNVIGVPLYGAHFAEYSYMGNQYYAHNVTIGKEFSQINEFANASPRFDFVGIFIFEP